MFNITHEIQKSLKRGVKQLSPKTVQKITQFILSQYQKESGLFIDRNGRGDWYYTAFALMLCSALKLKPPPIAKTPPENPDFVHYCSWCLAQLITHKISAFFWMGKRLGKNLTRFYQSKNDNFFPQEDRFTPYSQYLFQMTVRACGLPTKHADLELYQASDFKGAYSNFQYGTASLNATAAAVILHVIPSVGTIDYLKRMQKPEGGFLAHQNASYPDLLSTALALLALNTLHIDPAYSPVSFIQNCFVNNGGFAATDFEEDIFSDIEYTFYGLLATGSFSP